MWIHGNWGLFIYIIFFLPVKLNQSFHSINEIIVSPNPELWRVRRLRIIRIILLLETMKCSRIILLQLVKLDVNEWMHCPLTSIESYNYVLIYISHNITRKICSFIWAPCCKQGRKSVLKMPCVQGPMFDGCQIIKKERCRYQLPGISNSGGT